MFPVIGYVTRFEQQEGDRFSASVDVEVPEDVSHVQLDTEVFGRDRQTRLVVVEICFSGAP
jgi:hypothetical protein